MMFNAERIALVTIAALQRHLNRLLHQLYFEQPLKDEDFVSPGIDSPLMRRIELLVTIANGNPHHGKGDSDIREAWQSVHELMQSMPPQEQPADLVAVMQAVQSTLEPDQFISFQEAARLLRGDASATSLQMIEQLIHAGKLTVYLDTGPHKVDLLSRNEVLRLKASTR